MPINPINLVFSASPDPTYPSIQPYLKPVPYTPVSEAEFIQQREAIARQRRGIQLASDRLAVQIDEEKLKQQHLNLGIARLETLTKEQDYAASGQKLIQGRLKVASLRDVSLQQGQELLIGRNQAQNKVESARLVANELSEKNEQKRAVAGLSSGLAGLADQYAANAAQN
ncbi:MAG: hypothetical protein AAGD25_15050 [Cyanobacteria bacterium P01_F01_bin.150]